MQERAALRSIGVPLLLLCVACAPKKTDAPPSKPKPVVAIGQRAPEFTRPALPSGETITVPGDSRRVTAILFWATWSEPDLKMMTAMEEIAKVHSGHLRVVGVSIDESDDRLVEVAKAHGVTFPIVWDQNHDIANVYRPESDPALYLLDGDGILRFALMGYRLGDDEKIDDEVVKLLAIDPCRQPGRRNHPPLCERHCKKELCEKGRIERAEALATCNKPRPKKREACEAYCTSEELSYARDMCNRHSKFDPMLADECTKKCGEASCREQCRSR